MEAIPQDYRKTVLTPQTDFSMRANLPEREPARLKKWQDNKLYEKMQEGRSSAPFFILHDGPPYANGNIHLGHVMDKTLKDVVVKYKTMLGFRSPYVPGWDCHGLPIEQQVLKELGPKIHTMAPVEVRKLCHGYAAKYIDLQREQFKRLGVTGDWSRPYQTFDPGYEVGILGVLRDLVAKGLVRKGRKSVHWDPVFRTALAEAEIEYQTHTSDSIYVKFPLRDPDNYPSLKGLKDLSIVIWTTTPWTLPANLGVCLHPEFGYVVVASGGQHYIVAKNLVDSFCKACNLVEIRQVREFKAREIERALCDHPIFPDRTSLVILGDHVTLEQGTGCVHTAPGHGHDDFVIGAKYGLPVVVPVDDRGCFTDEYPEMKGTLVFDANPRIVEKLRAEGKLLAAGKIQHEYPYSWRSHKPIIFRATEQWFMELAEGGVRERALEAIDNSVEWIPSWGRDRIRGMVAQRPDWCLSRQRAWGVPIPAIRSKKEGKSILDLRIMDAFIRVVAEKGTDAWFTDPLSSFWPEGFVYEPTGESNPDDFEKEWDILDVWFDSGASHVACLERDPRLQSPADLYLEGSDQHRGWFQSALLTSIGARDRAPFRAVLTHGFVLDGQGKAMSKSLGNVISPLDLVKKTGADILRLWVVSEDYRGDVRFSEEILARVSEAYRRIRNALRFLLGNLYDFKAAEHLVPLEQLAEIDRWILSRLADLNDRVRKAYDAYELHRVYHLVYGFCNEELSAVYLDVTKDRLYCSAPGDPTRRAAQSTIHHIFSTLTRLLAPILVFTSEEAWESAYGQDQSVHLTDFPVAPPTWSAPELDSKWKRLLALRDAATLALEEARRAKTIGHSLDAEVTLYPADPEERNFISENLALLKILFIVSHAGVGVSGPDPQGERSIEVRASSAPKCDRCWMRDQHLGGNPAHPGLCPRCTDVVARVMNA